MWHLAHLVLKEELTEWFICKYLLSQVCSGHCFLVCFPDTVFFLSHEHWEHGALLRGTSSCPHALRQNRCVCVSRSGLNCHAVCCRVVGGRPWKPGAAGLTRVFRELLPLLVVCMCVRVCVCKTKTLKTLSYGVAGKKNSLTPPHFVTVTNEVFQSKSFMSEFKVF